jgi:hypothetical protein
VPLRIRPNPFWGARMGDIFRGQRAAAPVVFTATAVTTFASCRCLPRARGGSLLRGYGNHFCSGTAAEFRQADYPYGLRGAIRYQSRFKPDAENRTFP